MSERDIHVSPINDLVDHVDDEDCWCEPKIETFTDGRRVIVHNSADSRELIEQHGVN